MSWRRGSYISCSVMLRTLLRLMLLKAALPRLVMTIRRVRKESSTETGSWSAFRCRLRGKRRSSSWRAEYGETPLVHPTDCGPSARKWMGLARKPLAANWERETLPTACLGASSDRPRYRGSLLTPGGSRLKVSWKRATMALKAMMLSMKSLGWLRSSAPFWILSKPIACLVSLPGKSRSTKPVIQRMVTALLLVRLTRAWSPKPLPSRRVIMSLQRFRSAPLEREHLPLPLPLRRHQCQVSFLVCLLHLHLHLPTCLV